MKDSPKPPSTSAKNTASRPDSRKVLVLRYGLFALAGLLSLIALFYVVENIRGARAWKAARAKAANANESLDLASIVPAAVPDEQNAAAAPIFAAFFDFDENQRNRRPKRVEEINSGLLIHRHPGSLPDPDPFRRGRRIDLAVWASYFQDAREPHPFDIDSSAATPAQIVISAFDDLTPHLDELVAASQRPFAVFPIAYEHHVGALLPHLNPIRSAAVILNTRAQAQLEEGNVESAHRDAMAAFQLAKMIEPEPILISGLVQIYALKSSLQTLWDGLDRHAWNESQLIEFERSLIRINLAQQFQHSLRGERTILLLAFEQCHNNPKFTAQLFDGSDDEVFLFRFQPSGWINNAKAAMVETHLDLFMPIADPMTSRFDTVRAAKAGTALKERISRHPIREWMFGMTFPAIGRAVERFALTQTHINQARVACALELAYLKSGERESARTYPAKLAELSKLFPNGIPGGSCTGKPFRYGLNSDGSFYLYSEGWNGTDEGGTVVLQGKRRLNETEADCVWRFPDGKQPEIDTDK